MRPALVFAALLAIPSASEATPPGTLDQPRYRGGVVAPPYIHDVEPHGLQFPPVRPRSPRAGGDLLGDVWEMREISDWSAVWIRRGYSRLFDGYWTNPNGERVRAVLEITSRGNAVTVLRRHPAGKYCRYDGRVLPDRVRVEGSYTCSWERTPMPWRAQIVHLRDNAPDLFRDGM